jgi:hypothetical protein
MEWNTTIGNFCETKYLGHPEPLNCFTCFFISYIPFIGLTKSFFVSSRLKNILYLLFITGFTSFGYHWNGYYIYKHLDEIPMIIAVWNGVQHSNKLIGNKNYIDIAANAYFTSMLAINAVPSLNYIFPFMFLISCLSLMPMIIYYLHVLHKSSYYRTQKLTTSKLCHKGMLIASSSGALWFITEKLCNPFFIFGHALWHIGIVLGMFYIITAVEYFHLTHYFRENNKFTYKLKMHNYIPLIQRHNANII